MTLTRRAFIGAALAAVAAPLLGTTIRPVNQRRCDGHDCDTVVDFDGWSTFKSYVVHFWPAENPQRYVARVIDARYDAQAFVDAFHRGEIPS